MRMSESQDRATEDGTSSDRRRQRDPNVVKELQGGAWFDRMAEIAAGDVIPRRQELRRAAVAVRRVVHGLANSSADEATLTDLADRLEAVAEVFEHAGIRPYEGFAESSNAGDPQGFFDHSPMLGVANPLAPPITLRLVDEATAEGTATFGPAYEGPPGCVHGGFVAAAFDEVLGAAQSLSGSPGMTGQLTVTYRSPTPLNEELRITGRFDRIEGRKVFASGTLHAGDRLCAESTAVFISVDSERFAKLQALRAERDARRSRAEDI